MAGTQAGSERVVKRGGPACDECKAKKKRCTHREMGEETVPVAGAGTQTRRRKRDEEGVQAPTDNKAASHSKDEKSAEKRVKREHRPRGSKAPAPTADKPKTKAAATQPKRGKHDLPADMLQQSISMSIHTTHSRELEKRLDEFDAKFKAAKEAMEEALVAGQAVLDIVTAWKGAWMANL